jgi:3-hydroxyacyl-CoA dehydrogenase
MGGGIAMVLANAGIPVLLKEADQAALDRGLATIHSNYTNSVNRGRFSQEGPRELRRHFPMMIFPAWTW